MALAAGSESHAAPAAVFTNPAPITVNDSASPPTTATPYPSSIVVSGLTGTISKALVTLNGFSHGFPDDVDMYLVGPTGANAVVLSDVGGSTGVTNLNITLDDAAAGSLPDAGPLTGGTFKPTNVNPGDTFPAPAPAPAGGAALSAFNGTNPNGTWNLYIVDDASGQAGSLSGGWTLTFTTNVPTGVQTARFVAVAANRGVRVRWRTGEVQVASGGRRASTAP